MYRHVRIVAEQVRSLKRNVRIAMEPDISHPARRSRYPFLPVLITDRASGSAKRESLVQMADREEICSLRLWYSVIRSSRDRTAIFIPQSLISFAVAALGGEIMIDTVDGKVAYTSKTGHTD